MRANRCSQASYHERMEEQRRPLPGSERSTPPGTRVGPANLNEQGTVSIYLHANNATSQKRVEDYVRANGLSVDTTDSVRRVIVASGALAQLQAAFGVELAQYEADGKRFNGRQGALLLPESLHADVL